MVGLSFAEKHFIQGGIAQDLRTDGRKRLHYRPISVETGVIAQANGSARVRMGATDVIVSVKAELGKPSILQPDKGKVAIFVDCSPTAAPMFEGRGGEELSAELSVSLQRCLLGGKSGTGAGIDLSSLMVVEGKLCWDLYIDGLVVSSDGNLLDALGAAIKRERKTIKLLWVLPLVGLVMMRWAYGFEELNVTEISYVEAYGVSIRPLMVGPTLLQGAVAKGAGGDASMTSPLSSLGDEPQPEGNLLSILKAPGSMVCKEETR